METYADDDITILWNRLLGIKKYRGDNFHQQMALLQNQWRLNGGKIVDETRYISAQDLRVMQQTQCTHL